MKGLLMRWAATAVLASLVLASIVLGGLAGAPDLLHAQVLTWTRQFGSLGGNAKISATAVDGSDVYVAGNVQGGLPGQTWAGGADAYVRKYDASGAIIW